MDLPMIHLMRRGRLLRPADLVAAPRGAGLPALPPSGPDADPPQPPRTRCVDYRCGHCGRVFIAFTGTALHGAPATTQRIGPLRPQVLPKACPPPNWPELDCDRSELLELRHRLQDAAFRNRDRSRWTTRFWRRTRRTRTRGKKGVPHRDPEDPPRRRANQAPWTRQLGERPATGLRGGGPRERPTSA